MKDLSKMMPAAWAATQKPLALDDAGKIIVLEPGTYARRVDLGPIRVEQTAAVLIASGVRNVSLLLTGAKVGDAVLLIPSAAMPVGYSLGTPTVTADGTLSVPVTGPALAIGATYTILCRAVAIR